MFHLKSTVQAVLQRLPVVYHALGHVPVTWSVTGLGQIRDTSLWPFVLQQLFTEQAAGKGNGKKCWELTHKVCPFMGAQTQAWVTSENVWSDHASNFAKLLSNWSLLLDLQRSCQEPV